jgi:hypothetical protein
MTVAIPERIREKFLNEILEMYAEGEISAGKAAEMLGFLVQHSISYYQRRGCRCLKNLIRAS